MPHHTNNKDNSTRVLYVRVEVIWNNSESTLVKKKKKNDTAKLANDNDIKKHCQPQVT